MPPTAPSPAPNAPTGRPARSSSGRFVALACLSGTVLFWGTSFTATKTALVVFSPMMVVWLRWTVAAVAFTPFWWRIPRPRYQPGDWRLLGLASLFIPCLYYGLEAFALQFTSSSQAGVISAIVPLLVAVGAWVFLAEKPNWQQVLAIAVSLVGVAVLSTTGAAQESAPAPLLGNALELAAMVAAAGSMLTVKHLSTRYHPWFLTGMQAVVGMVFFAPFAFASGPVDWARVPVSAWAAVVYLGVFCSLAAFGLYNTALKLLPAGRAALAVNAIPAVAIVAGWLVLGEALSVAQLVACAAIIGAVVFAEVAGHVPAEVPVDPFESVDASPE